MLDMKGHIALWESRGEKGKNELTITITGLDESMVVKGVKRGVNEVKQKLVKEQKGLRVWSNWMK